MQDINMQLRTDIIHKSGTKQLYRYNNVGTKSEYVKNHTLMTLITNNNDNKVTINLW